MPRFVVQHHLLADGDEHWDLMFEVQGALWTWSLPCPPDAPDCVAGRPAAQVGPGPAPAAAPDQALSAEMGLPAIAKQLPDHRLEYLEYEGEVSGGRGRVEIHDRGTYDWLGEAPGLTHHTIDILEFRLDGRRAAGRFRLKRIPHEGTDLWRLSRLPTHTGRTAMLFERRGPQGR